MRLMPPEYHPVDGYDAVWAEDEKLTHLSENEISEFLQLNNQFPLYSEISYSSTVIAGLEKEGSGKVIGYCLRVAKNLLSTSYFYLLVMTKNGLMSVNQVDAEPITNNVEKDNTLCSTIAMGM